MRGQATLACALCAAAAAAHAETLYLVIAASAAEPAVIAAQARTLRQNLPQSRIVHMADCGTKRQIYALVAAAAGDEAEARAGVDMVQPYAPDAYVRRCEVVSGSLLAIGVDAVDKSIADVPAHAVNWDDADRVSEARALPGGRTLVVQRVYAPAPDDPLEGRRERLLLVRPGAPAVTLAEHCASPGRAATRGGLFALQCSREQAGPYILHSVLAFGAKGEKLADIAHCRDLRWQEANTLSCSKESVDATGKLRLVPYRVRIEAAASGY
ncbi:MAG: hypothetical protein JNJ60_15320 [Rhodocyclaceae bacterium]|nr:hypothetical protein [Rhodocyclaceae bacterium]